ncbi:MAG: zinc-ribbon domain-containing protein, partial [Nitrospirota bacterium]|nr:zinc-ribbon domain-containing protein [Nitrospirota bacterium]
PHHVWRASLKSRYSKRTGCRRCTLAMRAWNNESFQARTLSRKSPELAATWHPTKNGTLTPKDVTFNSRQRVWWQCPSNPHHVWDTTVNNRQRSNCPFCAGRFHRAIGSRHRWQDPISLTHPHLVPEWHPTRNGRISPNQVTAGSKRLIWWQCALNPDHAWQTPVHRRTLTRSTCPLCRNERRRVLELTREKNPQPRKSRFLRPRPRPPANPLLPWETSHP